MKAGVVHELPKDIEEAIISKNQSMIWENNLTPLARNEWICYIISAKKKETRLKRITRMNQDLSKDKKRPCCWPGCPHR